MQLKPFKIKLEAEKVRLEAEMGSVGRPNSRVPGDWEPAPSETGMEADQADQADAMMNRESNTAILADLEARYGTVLSSLARIEKKKYGACEVCQEDIGERRLTADPAATTCVKHM